tara:strand:- start:1673 stop:2932 length:1260 start_codon:yes stop_codon:yes gene_type:complete
MTKHVRTFYFCALIFIFSCTDPNLIGLEVQPPSDGIFVELTSANNNLKLITISEDSLRSDEASALLLGNSTNDDIFGDSWASFATQFQLPFNNVDVGNSDSLTIDSVILSLGYTGIYGEENQNFYITVEEISESIHKDSVYYSNHIVEYSNQLASLPNITFNMKDSVSLAGVMNAPHFRLPLNNSLGERILTASGSPDLEDNTQFIEFFKGIYVAATATGEGAIAYLSPTSSNSKLTVYYHSTNVYGLSLDFSLAGDAARVNLFNQKSIPQLVGAADTANNTYVQSMAGYKTLIEVQHLDTLKTFFKNKAINRVNLDFELDGTQIAEYAPHNRMYLVRVDEDGKDYFLTDYIIEGEGHFGGFLENGKYTFNITRYFHQLLTNSSFTNKLYLVSSGGAVNANRTILPKEKVKFNIIYTDL